MREWLWLNDGLSRCECQVTMADLTGMQQQSVWSFPPTAHAAMRTCRPSGLLMVRAVLTLAVKVWLCGMTHISRLPKLYCQNLAESCQLIRE